MFILTWTCASRHNGMHFFIISTSKKAPRMVCFARFDFDMCLAPQRLALFHHLNFPRCSQNCALYILTSTSASCHTSTHFFIISTSKSAPRMVCFARSDLDMCFAPQRRAIFISHLARWLRTRRFREPTFRPSGATNHWKTLFAYVHLLSSDFFLFSDLLFSSLLFSSLLFSGSFHICFSISPQSILPEV